MNIQDTISSKAGAKATTILIVDDEPAGRETLAALLRAYHLEFASSGPEAIGKAAACSPDLILLDVMMPGMDGFEVCRRLRATPELAEVPIVLVTALDDRESRIAGLDAGADDFVSKPFDLVELRTRVQTIMRLNRYQGLRAERAKLAHVIEFAPDSMLIVEETGTIALANPAAARLLGASDPAELIGRALVAFVTPERRAEYTAFLEATTASAGASVRFETMLAPTTGRSIAVELHVGNLAWDGRPAAQVIARDISDRKRAELLEEERRQIAYDIHDGLAQTITSAHQHLQAYAARHRPRSPEARAELDRALDLARRSVREARRVIAGLRPTALDDFGLVAALAMHVESLRADGWEIGFEENLGAERLPPAAETVIFRVVQEALTNVRKHAQTKRVQVRLERAPGMLRLSVRDWGRGFEPEALPVTRRPGERIGLHGMRERIALLGGSWQLESSAGNGTTVLAEIPLQ